MRSDCETDTTRLLPNNVINEPEVTDKEAEGRFTKDLYPTLFASRGLTACWSFLKKCSFKTPCNVLVLRLRPENTSVFYL